MMLSRVFVSLLGCVLLAMVWGCNGIVGVEAPIEQKMVVLPVAPSQCQALYHVPIQAKEEPTSLVFPKGATVAELPARVDGDGGATCTLVVVRDGKDKQRVFWKIRTNDEGFTGMIQCAAEGYTSPTFDIKAQRSRSSKLYVYASVEQQAQVAALLRKGKTTATWHRGEHDNSDLYEQTKDGSLKRKEGMSLYKDCALD